ncbi:MAG: branched-chain amino acid ABC transporter permease [Rhodospirillaceae bacterium]|jgi:branched-chain amino acid transport system permease protein|nr:branched-chain amino acid ABC transporter permease [Rhodospirillaceae bacterium]MBT4490331.1 branched-chain amino acid ABC transporter permease [Rhodospirillaceae bacterium]MBT5192400.1 branched-chain amino acid ABC transporter permease [Rhodospirillaceae bacterium]MBT5899204.1 branched-chain amino acid ABC transporter permease [Rhodospirillaceae bacterium]MBT6430914.1 branched-chain amino acid ABC transporter permease [Rhodospirillaceae bacterium]
MEELIQQVLGGIATGAIYACIALSVVMIYQAIDHFNFAQGEMAMFSAFITWQMIDWGANYWVAFFICIAVSFIGGVAIERIVFAPLHNAPVFTHIVVFIALFQIFNAGAGFIWEFTIKEFPSPFPERLPFDTTLIGPHELGMTVVTLIMLGLIFLFFRFTPIGLAMRAAAAAPDSARLVGISVGWMLALGWGLAAAIGAVGGMMIAPVVYLEPNMMLGILLYGFAGAVVGGLTSPGGAVLGGFLMGVIEPLAGMAIGSELKLTVALVVIVTILIFKPSGLFGRVVVQRV